MTAPLLEYEGAELPAPKFWTPRDYTRPTIGTRRSEFSTIWLGAPLMPWQRLVSDVMGELGDDGLPFYDMGVVTVQRQAGKSHLSMVKTCERCVSVPKWRAWYTAQTGGDARDQFLKFQTDNIEGTPLERLTHVLRSNGHEQMTFPNKSWLRPHPPVETALHGKQCDENDIDEAWSFSMDEGRALLQAISPTQLTRPSAQTWVWSAGGTAKSTWLAQLVADGRQGARTMTVVDGAAPVRVAYFEWGIPDDLDLGDLEAIAAYHPAVGHTITLNGLRKLRSQLTDDDDFARAAGNRWTSVIGGAIRADVWKAARWDGEIPEGVPVAYGAARAADGSEVAVAAAARVGDIVLVEVLDVLPVYGAESTVSRWVGSDPVAVDPFGASASLHDALKVAGVRLYDLSGRDVASGVDTFLDALAAGAYKFRPRSELDDAVKVAATRRVSDGGRAWSRTGAGASIAALEAADKAAYALVHKPVPAPKPQSRFAA